MSPQWVMVSSVLNEPCAIFSQSDSLCIQMTLTEWVLTDGGRQKPLEMKRDKDLPPSARLLISVIFIYIVRLNKLRETKKTHLILEQGVLDLYWIPLHARKGSWMLQQWVKGIAVEMMSEYHIQEYSVCTLRMICQRCKHPYSCVQFQWVTRWLS